MTRPLDIDDELVVELAERRDEMAAARRLPADLAGRIAHAGLFRMLVPAARGGGEVHPAVVAATLERLASVNSSAAWCVMIATTTSSLAGRMHPAGADEVFADPEAVWGGTYAPVGAASRSGGEWLLSGSWQWGSGSENCSWFVGGAVCDDGVPRLFWVPRSAVSIEPNWDVIGLEGTGSHDWSVDAVTVPPARVMEFDLGDADPRIDAPLYRFPLFGLLAVGIAGVALGVAAGALDAFVDLASAKTPTGSRRRLGDREVVQGDVGRSSVELAAARSHLHATVDRVVDNVSVGRAPTVAERAELRLAATHAVRTSARVTTRLHDHAGGSSVRSDSAIGQAWRDAHVITQHVMVGPATFVVGGREILGHDVSAGEL